MAGKHAKRLQNSILRPPSGEPPRAGIPIAIALWSCCRRRLAFAPARSPSWHGRWSSTPRAASRGISSSMTPRRRNEAAEPSRYIGIWCSRCGGCRSRLAGADPSSGPSVVARCARAASSTGSPGSIASLGSRAAVRTRGGAPSSPMPPGSCSRREVACAMFSNWRGTGR